MALKRYVEALEDVAEELRGLYTADSNGKGFRLDAEPDDGGELKRSLQSARHERDEAKRERDELKSQVEGIAAKLDGVELDDLLRASKKQDNDDSGAAVSAQIEAAREEGRKQIADKLAKEIEARDAQINGLQSAIQTTYVRETGARLLAEEQGNVTLLMPAVERAFRAVPNGDDFVVRVFDENGQERISQQAGNDGPMSPAEYIRELKGDPIYARAFDGSGASGGGAPKNGNGGAGTVSSKADLSTVAEKAAYCAKHGAAAYQELPDGT